MIMCELLRSIDGESNIVERARVDKDLSEI